jgi:hypothetical protein
MIQNFEIFLKFGAKIRQVQEGDANETFGT